MRVLLAVVLLLFPAFCLADSSNITVYAPGQYVYKTTVHDAIRSYDPWFDVQIVCNQGKKNYIVSNQRTKEKSYLDANQAIYFFTTPGLQSVRDYKCIKDYGSN